MVISETKLRQIIRAQILEQTDSPRDVAFRLELALEQYVKIVLTQVRTPQECKQKVTQFVENFLSELDLLGESKHHTLVSDDESLGSVLAQMTEDLMQSGNTATEVHAYIRSLIDQWFDSKWNSHLR